MERDECWMTFTEALEEYLENRERLRDCSDTDCYRDMYESNLDEAKRHLEALTKQPMTFL